MSELHKLAGDVSHPAPARDRVSPWLLLTSVLLAPSVWAVQILCSYGLASMSCFPRYTPLEGTQVPGITVIVEIGSFVALALAGVALWAAITAWRRTHREHRGGKQEALDAGEGRTRFIALCGVILTGLFTAAIIWEAMAAILLQHCFNAV